MKREDLFEAIGNVDDMLLEENAAPAGRRNWLPFLVSAAACIGIVAAAVKLLPPQRQIEPRDMEMIESEVRMSETYLNAPPETDPPMDDEDMPADTSEEIASVIADRTELSASEETIAESEPKASVCYAEPKDDPNSFCYVLTQIYEKQNYMDIFFQSDASSDLSGNRFAICDVDGDGSEELVFLWEAADMASMRGVIYGRDTEGKIICEFQGTPFIRIYSNGLLRLDEVNDQGEAFPYTLYRYNAASDAYEDAYDVQKWDSEMLYEQAETVPADAQISDSEIVYFVGEHGPLDEAAFLAWETETFGNAYELDLPFRSFTEAEIAAVNQ